MGIKKAVVENDDENIEQEDADNESRPSMLETIGLAEDHVEECVKRQYKIAGMSPEEENLVDSHITLIKAIMDEIELAISEFYMVSFSDLKKQTPQSFASVLGTMIDEYEWELIE